MIRHRCPWCGEYLPPLFERYDQSGWLYALQKPLCPKCNRPYERKHDGKSSLGGKIGFGWAVLCFAAYFAWRQFEEGVVYNCLLVLCLLLLSVTIPLRQQSPFVRHYSKKEKSAVPPKQKVKTQLTWTPRENEGLKFPKAQIEDGEIFPACFFDADKTLISPALCVTLENIEWQGSRQCTCEISLVLDNAPAEQLLCQGNSFELYLYHRAIAAGEIR